MAETSEIRGIDDLLVGQPAVGMEPNRLRRVSTTEALVGEIVTRILSGELPPGANLREVELATRFSVSRQSVREALGVLVQRGMLRREAHRGAHVPQLTRADVADIYDMRQLVESEAIRRVVSRPDSWPSIDRAVRRFDELDDDRPWAEVVQADVGFHLTLVQAAGSPRLLRLYEPIAIDMSLAQVPVREFIAVGDMVGAHRSVYDTIASGETEAALKLLEEHLRWGFRELIDRLPDKLTS